MDRSPTTPRWLLSGSLVLLALFGLLLGLIFPFQSLFASVEHRGYDPLTPAEETTAEQLALQNSQVQNILNSARQVELLNVERHQEDKTTYALGSWDRRAVLHFYLYGQQFDQDQLLTVIVNLTDQTVDNSSLAAGVQPPLNETEEAHVLDIALTNETIGLSLQQFYNQHIGPGLFNPEQMLILPFIFRPDSIPDIANQPDIAVCGQQRCIQLLVYTREGELHQLMPIMNLTQNRIVHIHYFGEGSQND